MFKPKRNKGKRAARSNEQPTGAVDDDEDQQADVATIKQFQQARTRKLGLAADALLAGDKSKGLDLGGKDSDDGEEQGGLGGGFAKAKHKQGEEEDPQMQAFIEAELAKRTGRATALTDAQVLAASRAPPAPDTVDVPENLRGQVNDLEIAGTWVSGITEVAVPVKYKMENIEATEEAKKRLLMGTQGDGQSSGRTTPEQPFLRRTQLPMMFGAKQLIHTNQDNSFVAEQMRIELRERRKKRRLGA